VISFRHFVLEQNKTNVLPNEIKKGDKVENCNKKCKHYKSKGVVTSVDKIKDGDNVVGNVVKYKVKNKGRNYKSGQELEKTEIQLKKVK
jgi:hypothetical protein